MAAMARLLASRTHVETTADEATHEKATFQAIQREFHEADEANLLEEEDMHVFDSRPLSDPLHLVSCNACKKPIKASQYALHAERCRNLNFLDGTSIELEGGLSHNKSVRKGRKKMQIPHDYRGSCNAELEKPESIDRHGVTGSKPNVEERVGQASSLPREKRIYSNTPAPLATKLYYLRGHYRLRTAIHRLYVESSVNNISNNSCLKVMQDNIMNQHDKCRIYAANILDENMAQSSDLCNGGYGPRISDASSPNQIQEGIFSLAGRFRYNSSPSSFPLNPGSSLGGSQQPNGTVPVIL